ncbi:MAG: flagellum-specific ATP synthase FliI, partial [Oscillospiraceae bacterium]
LRNLLSLHEDNIDLVSIGAYKEGSNKDLDLALSKINDINNFLMQSIDDKISFDETVNILKKVLA